LREEFADIVFSGTPREVANIHLAVHQVSYLLGLSAASSTVPGHRVSNHHRIKMTHLMTRHALN
jgi:hypothetical protein